MTLKLHGPWDIPIIMAMGMATAMATAMATGIGIIMGKIILIKKNHLKKNGGKNHLNIFHSIKILQNNS